MRYAPRATRPQRFWTWIRAAESDLEGVFMSDGSFIAGGVPSSAALPVVKIPNAKSFSSHGSNAVMSSGQKDFGTL